MVFEFDNDLPIYIQLVEQIKIQIISGNLSCGEKLPSVRDFALQTKVNPNTMQKALTELEQLGLIYTERTNGKFITQNKELIENYKIKYAEQLSEKYLNSMKKIGFSMYETIGYLTKFGGQR